MTIGHIFTSNLILMAPSKKTLYKAYGDFKFYSQGFFNAVAGVKLPNHTVSALDELGELLRQITRPDDTPEGLAKLNQLAATALRTTAELEMPEFTDEQRIAVQRFDYYARILRDTTDPSADHRDSIRTIEAIRSQYDVLAKRQSEFERWMKENQAKLGTLRGSFSKLEASAAEHVKNIQAKSKDEILEAERLAKVAADSHVAAAKASTDAIESYFENKKVDIEGKETNLNSLIGSVASKLIAGGYAGNAADERRSANFLRACSIALMGGLIFLLALTLHELSSASIDPFSLISRMAITLFLSVPITYLAREAEKHRTLQHKYLQTALDLDAITPYLAALPTENSNKIRVDMANKVFFSDKPLAATSESMPINLQELLIKIVDKLEFPGSKRAH